MRTTLKTMVSNPSEIPFLWMMFEEAAPFVDRIIVTEFNQTHSGLERDFIFQDYVDSFQREFSMLDYLQGSNISGVVRNAQTSDEHHHNETLMRGWFARQLRFRSSEVIFSTDADEVLYGDTYRWVKDNFRRGSKGVRFRLHQFFYRPNFLWKEQEFIAPVALRFKPYNKEYPNNWRYQGKRLDGKWGVHFSWCIPAEEMAQKLLNYSHANEQKHLSNVDLMRQARKLKQYPFDPTKPFTLETLPYSSEIIPKSFAKYMHLIDGEVLGVEGVDW